MIALALAVTASSVGWAQSSVRGLEDLVGVGAAMGEYHLKQRGYTLSHSDRARHATLHYYSKGGNCIVVEDENGYYGSLRMTAPENCRDNGVRSDQGSLTSLRDLVGLQSRSGADQLQRRGYTFARAEKFSNADFHYYSNDRSCVAVEVADGRYKSIRETAAENCGNEAAEAPKALPENRVEFPHVRADTDGAGSYYVPGLGSSQADRGYVWLHEDWPMIGFSYEGQRHAKFYGPITRRLNDREYEMEIQDSNLGAATGTGKFRLSPNLEEVEIVEVNGRIGGQRFSGKFERAWMEEKRKTPR